MSQTVLPRELRVVAARTQMSNDPEIDLARTAFNPLLLLSATDLAELQHVKHLLIEPEAQTIGSQHTADEGAAKIVLERASHRLVDFMSARAPATKSSKLQRPPRPAKTEVNGRHAETNFGGEIKLVPGRWCEGPILGFTSPGEISEAIIEVAPRTLDFGLVCLIRKVRSLACAIIVNETFGSFGSFNGTEIRGDWRVSFLMLGSGSSQRTIDLHKLTFRTASGSPALDEQ